MAEILTYNFGASSFTYDSKLDVGLQSRQFSNFHHAALEAVISRFYGGVHYKFSCYKGYDDGIIIGKNILDRLGENHVFCDFIRDGNGNIDENLRYIFRDPEKGFYYSQHEFKWESYLLQNFSFFRKDKKNAFIATVSDIPELAIHLERDSIEDKTKAMYQAIAELSKIDKAIVMLYLEDYSYAEISEIIGITANNIAVKMNRIKVKLREATLKNFERI
mgnify:CR=1 FL=1